MIVIAVSSDAPLMVGAVSEALSDLGLVVPAGPVLGGSPLHARVWGADVLVVDSTPSVTMADVEASPLSSFAHRAAVVLLLSDGLAHRVADLLRLGVRGLLPRCCAVTELVEGVRCVLRGGVHLSPTLGARLVEQLVPGRPGPPLTSREHDVLDLLAKSYTNAEIATELALSGHTVKFHVSNILAKLGVASRREAVATWRAGPVGATVLPGPVRRIPAATAGPSPTSSFYSPNGRSSPASA